MKRFARIAGFIAALSLAVYFLWFSVNNINLHVLRGMLSPALLATLFFAALLYAAIIPLTGWAWQRLLIGQGQSPSLPWLIALLATTQLAKYVPGNIAQHASRAALAIRGGVTARILLVTVAQETVLAMAASLSVGFLMLAVSGRTVAQLPESSHLVVAWSVPVVFTIVISLASVRLPPDSLADSPNRILRLVGHMGGLPGARVAFPAFAAYALNYVLIGIGLWMVGHVAGLPEALALPLVTASFALAWLLGFLAPGAPAGLGVREGIMVMLLSGAASNEHLLAFVLLARLVTMLGDAINFLLGSWWFALEAKRTGTQ